jgi:hypothetical protein
VIFCLITCSRGGREKDDGQRKKELNKSVVMNVSGSTGSRVPTAEKRYF